MQGALIWKAHSLTSYVQKGINSRNVLEFTVSESYDFRTFYGLVLVIAYYFFFLSQVSFEKYHLKV